jgi:polyhydroxyalkanoate synthesis regulator phasin
MVDVLKDAFKLGLGAVDMARDEANKAVDHIQKNYKKETADGRKELKKLMDKTKDKAETMRKDIKREVKKAFKDTDLVTEKDFDEFTSTVEKLGKTTHKIVTRAADKVGDKMKTKKTTSKPTKKKKAAKKKQ